MTKYRLPSELTQEPPKKKGITHLRQIRELYTCDGKPVTLKMVAEQIKRSPGYVSRMERASAFDVPLCFLSDYLGAFGRQLHIEVFPKESTNGNQTDPAKEG